MQPLVVSRLNKRFKKHEVIQDLSFSLDRGLVYGFLGPNGSGKTMTIRMIASSISMDSGDVHIEGKSIRTEREQALRHIGAIVEDPDLYGYLTGRQNLQHFASMYPETISDERIEEVIRLVELENRIDDRVKKYSLGMKQRIGIAVSILHSPTILILDEPTNGLDPKGIRQLRHYLRKLAEEDNVTVFVSSHQLNEVEVLCDRAIVINDGKVVDELNMQDRHSGTEYTVSFEVQPKDRAIQVLSEFGSAQETATALDLAECKYEDIPAIVRALTAADVEVFAVKYQQRLEERYFSLTETKGREPR
ncbi:LOW QUALITY PROTEIN: ABC transporter, ATP-binding protein [Geomicrobium sp. JCM 19037]|nr:LOW QUALITY PROTEIN: ABC transporter, ATP-binding protein [Geomicrobium sp. JCM 19037]